MNIRSLFSISNIVLSQDLSKSVNRVLQFQDDKKRLGQAVILESRRLALKYKQKFLEKYETKLQVLLSKVKPILKRQNVEFTDEEGDEEIRTKEICDLTVENVAVAVLQILIMRRILRIVVQELFVLRVPYALTALYNALVSVFETLIFYQDHVACLLILFDIWKALSYNMNTTGIIGKILHIASTTLLGLYKKGYVSKNVLINVLPLIRGAASAVGRISTIRG